jgi:hypothetical protein
MKIGIIIPHRNNRPFFLMNCFRMIDAQTVKADIVELINESPLDEKVDITWRYKTGYDRLRNQGLDAIFLMEDDDWYAPTYLETMLHEWIKAGSPDIFGPNFTIYYHLMLKKYFKFDHDDRSSAMSTLIKPDMDFPWCPDSEPYTDMHLWKVIQNKKLFKPDPFICIGIKHGIGLSGGQHHNTRIHRYKYELDLKSFMDPESFRFYDEYFQKHPDEAEYVRKEININQFRNL